jgi:hypothetical protein
MGRHDDPIMHPLAFPASGNDPSASQIRQVPGDFGLRLAEDFDEIADADFLVAHEIEQTKPGVVAKSLKEAFQVES